MGSIQNQSFFIAWPISPGFFPSCYNFYHFINGNLVLFSYVLSIWHKHMKPCSTLNVFSELRKNHQLIELGSNLTTKLSSALGRVMWLTLASSNSVIVVNSNFIINDLTTLVFPVFSASCV